MLDFNPGSQVDIERLKRYRKVPEKVFLDPGCIAMHLPRSVMRHPLLHQPGSLAQHF